MAQEVVVDHNPFQCLLQAFHDATTGPPKNLHLSLSNLPDVGMLPSPWTSWLLIVLVQYHSQQQWARNVSQQYVPDAFPPSASLLALKQPFELPLTGMPEWELILECACDYGSLKHRETGETIFFRLSKTNTSPSFADILPWWKLPAHPSSCKAQFAELHPSDITAYYCLGDLESAGFLEGFFFDESDAELDIIPDAYKLTESVLKYSEQILQYCWHWEQREHCLWLAAIIGDWPTAHKFALQRSDDELVAITFPRSEKVRTQRIEQARRNLTR